MPERECALSGNINADQFADALMQELNKYAKAASEDVKKAVQETAKEVSNEIKSSAPRRTGKYAASWSAK